MVRGSAMRSSKQAFLHVPALTSFSGDCDLGVEAKSLFSPKLFCSECFYHSNIKGTRRVLHSSGWPWTCYLGKGNPLASNPPASAGITGVGCHTWLMRCMLDKCPASSAIFPAPTLNFICTCNGLLGDQPCLLWLCPGHSLS